MPSLSGNDVKVTISTKADTAGVTQTQEALGGLSTKTAAVMGAMAGAAQSLVNSGINLITSSIGDAVSRVDTLNNAPKVLNNLGFDASASSKSVKTLSDHIKGLPTALSDIVQEQVAVASSTDYNIGKVTDLTIAFNDMALAGGKGPAEAQRAFVQFTQALGRGKFQAQDFNTLMEVMPAQLSQVAKSLLAPTANAVTLKNALSDGTVTNDQFVNSVISLDKNGGTGIASFASQAKDATSGIATGAGNMKLAIVRGLTDIMTAIGTGNIANALSNIGKAAETAFKAGAAAIRDIVQWIKDATKFFNEHKKVIEEVALVITALLLPAMIAFGIKSAISLGAYIASMTIAGVESLIAGGQMALAWLMALGPIGLVIIAVAAAAALIIMNWDAVKKFLSRAWSDIKQWGVDAWQAIVGVWQGAASWFGGVFSGITNWARNTVNDIVSFFTDLPGRIVSAVGNIGSRIAGDVKGAFKSLHIPGFATGVRNFSGGMAVVGENGPELVGLPAGSNVYTNNESKGMMRGSGTTQTVTIGNIYLQSAEAVNTFFAKLDQDNILSGKGLTPNRGMR